MHIAVYAITDLRSLRSVIKALRKINQCPKVLEIPDEAEERIYNEIGRSDPIRGASIRYLHKHGAFFTVDDCHIVAWPRTELTKR